MGLRPKPPAVASGDPIAPRRVRRAALCAAWDRLEQLCAAWDRLEQLRAVPFLHGAAPHTSG